MHLKSSFPTSLYTQTHTHTRVAWAAVSQLRRKSQLTIKIQLILKKSINNFNSTSSDLSTDVMQKDHKRKKRGEEHVCVFSNCISAIVKLILWHLNLWGKTILTEKHEELSLFKECCSVYKSDFSWYCWKTHWLANRNRTDHIYWSHLSKPISAF